MQEALCFKNREEFRNWLVENCEASEGVWLCFHKTKNATTLKASEALEEALCFGWIDGLMKCVDEDSYIKYFSMRRKDSKWSEKNKALVANLEKRGLLREQGKSKIEEAKKNRQWEKKNTVEITEEEIEKVAELCRGNDTAYRNFQAMSCSVRKTYTRAYLDAKTEAGKKKRLAWMLDRLERNLKPM